MKKYERSCWNKHQRQDPCQRFMEFSFYHARLAKAARRELREADFRVYSLEISLDKLAFLALYLTAFTAHALMMREIVPSRANGKLSNSLSRNRARRSSLIDMTYPAAGP